MRWGVLWTLLPDEALPLLIAGVGLAMILGLLRGRAALGILLMLLLAPVLASFVEVLMEILPPWISLIVLAVIGLSILKGLAALLIGPRAADTMVGSLAADLVRLAVRILIFPLRVLGWALGAAINGRR